MTPETFFQHFETLTDTPDAVAKMRQLILQLAVMGKLAPQDPNDEPASVLLEKIKAERERFIQDGKIKRGELLPPVDSNKVPFLLPRGWVWTCIGSVLLTDTGGGTPSKQNPSYWNGDVPWASVKDIGKSKYLGETIDHISQEGLKNSSSNLIPKGRIIVCTRMGLGKLSINTNDVAINQDLRALWLSAYIDIDFFYNFFLTREVSGSGMTVKGIKRYDLLMMPFPLPPPNEQKRIVGRVEQLMAMCDQLEVQRESRREARIRLNGIALSHLTNAPDANTFHHAWSRIRDHFHLLYDHPQTVAQLRQTILQLAVMGKLVPQDPNDEPASVLLEKIKAEKERLIREGKIKQGAILPQFDPEKLDNVGLAGWSKTRLINICQLITDGTHQTPKYTSSGRIFLSAQNVKPFKFSPQQHRFVSEADYQGYIKNVKPEIGDVLLTRVGAGIGESAVIDKQIDFAIYVSLGLIRPFKDYIFPYFLSTWLNSPLGRRYSSTNTLGKGVSQGNLNLNLIRMFEIDIPPLAEQKRIVACVGQLMAMCDHLESQLTQSRDHGQRLLDVAVAQLAAV